MQSEQEGVMKLNPAFSKGMALACFLSGLAFSAALVRSEATPRGPLPAAQAAANSVAVDSTSIGGVVTSPKGPEAGVWVIAETTDLPTKFRKIVVTDDAGRYLLPELPKATYKIWVRGYGLVDSKTVTAKPGSTPIPRLRRNIIPPTTGTRY
jgi:hypothetical protein